MELKSIAIEYGLDLETITLLFDLLYPDIDGIWSSLQDEGIEIDIDDLARVEWKV